MAALPVNIPTVTVHGTYVGPDARPLAGTVTFSAPNMLTFPDSDLFIAGPVVAVLDENGRFEVRLPATDAPGMNPSGWAYVVKENLSGVIGGRTFSLLLPQAKPDVDLADLAPADPSTPNYVPVAGSQVITGAGVPPATLGRDGDFYTQYEATTFLGITSMTVTMWTRTAGAWIKVGDGIRGAAWYVNTTTTPSVDTRPGDMLLRSDSGDIWQRGASGWGSPVGNLKGPKGDVGAKGATGAAGAVGAAGPQGPKGDPGNGSVNKVNNKLGPDVVLVAADVGAVAAAEKGAANGVATLDAGGKVPAAQLSTPAGVVTSVNTKPGPTVTLTAADVSALASTARGAASGVAPLDAGSRVPVANLPDLAIPDEWAPADLGLKAWAFDPATAISSPAYTGNGTLRFVAVVVRETVSVSKIAFHFGGYSEKLTAGSWAAIYTTAGALKGTTADMVGVTVVPGVHNAGGATVGAALTAAVSLTPGMYYVAFVFRYAGTDGPMLLQLENAFGAPPNIFGLTPVKRFGVWAGGAVATTAPATIDPASIDNGSNRFWVGLG
ncbi:hypothetical protein ACFVRB_15135 [Streptomyces nojiriensis]|uniref:hypothetical protein n=1 Tax=Streptomyces nojiriensis TaxID=66374 RepID=UPI0036DB8FBD